MKLNYNSEIEITPNKFIPENFVPNPINLSISPSHLYELHKKYSWKEIADIYQRSERTIYRWLDPEIKSKQKEGRKFKVSEEDRKFLAEYAKEENNTSTQQSMADYVFQERGISISQQTVSRILKEQGVTYKTLTYHYQQIVSQQEINYFIDRTRNLPPYQLLALDECGFHLNEDPRRGYSLKGTRAISQRPSSKGEHYTLLLCIGNTEKDGVVHYQLIKGGAKVENFYNFLEGINLTNDWKYYLLLDNARIHHAKKKCIDLGLLPIKELLISRNIQPVYFPPYTPQLNPTELCFNFIRNYIERRRPRTFEELKSLIDEAMEELNKKDLREYFKHCWDYFKKIKNTDTSCE